MTLRDDHHATRERSRDEQCPTIGQEAQEGSHVHVGRGRREGYAELEVDAKVELIRSLIPLGLLHIEELLDGRTLRSVGGRHGSNPGTVGLAGQRVRFACRGFAMCDTSVAN